MLPLRNATCFIATVAYLAAASAPVCPGVVHPRLLPSAAQRGADRGRLQVLYSFRGGKSDGALPAAGILTDKTGALFGTTQAGGAKHGGTVFKLTPSESGYAESVLHAFVGGKNDGALPLAGLIADNSGALYGTTAGGGSYRASSACVGYAISGCGTVFKLTQSGSGYAESILYKFRGVNAGDGLWPYAGLTADKAGDLYGTTYIGGATLGYAQGPGGSVFKLTPSSNRMSYSEALLFTFQYSPSGPTLYPDGLFPSASLLPDDSGAFYGTASIGGVCPVQVQAFGCGVVFKLTPSASGYAFRLLYLFQGGSDGAVPVAGLVEDKNGALYGTTEYGGAGNLGTVFKLTPTGSGTYTESVLYAFAGGNDGALPVADLIAEQGALYGTTSSGGSANQGTIFKLTPAASGYTETISHAFQGGVDGGEPFAGLVSGKGGMYGTTMIGGASGLGTVFVLKR